VKELEVTGVLANASGACFGRDSASGAINVILKRPPGDEGCLRVVQKQEPRWARGPLTVVGSDPKDPVAFNLRVDERSGEWRLPGSRPWRTGDRWALNVGLSADWWSVPQVTTGTLVTDGPGSETGGVASDDTIQAWSTQLTLRTPYGDLRVEYAEGDGSASATEAIGGAQNGFVYHVPSPTGSLGLNVGRTGSTFQLDTELQYVGLRYALPWYFARHDSDDCKYDFRPVIDVSRFRQTYVAEQRSIAIPSIYSETNQRVEEDRFELGIVASTARYFAAYGNAFSARASAGLGIGYRRGELTSEQNNYCGAPGCSPAATFTARVSETDSGWAWSASLAGALDWHVDRNSRLSLTAGYRHVGEAATLVNPVRTINLDGPPRLAADDVDVWRIGVGYRYTF
jgi:hypothetical protein